MQSKYVLNEKYKVKMNTVKDILNQLYDRIILKNY